MRFCCNGLSFRGVSLGKKSISLLLILMAFFLIISPLAAFAKSRDDKSRPRSAASKKAAPVTSEAGFKIPEWGIAIDASYDPRLDDLIPGYKILHVVLSNHRENIIVLNPIKDRWVITDSGGKKHEAYNHVKFFDKKLWQKMRPELKNRLDYPTMVKSGNLVTIDLFFPKSADLFQFREIAWNSSFFAKKFDVLTSYEKTLSVNADDKQQALPQPANTLTVDEAYLKSRDEVLGANKSGDTFNSERQNPSLEENKDGESKSSFDPSFDDAIIIR